MNNLSSACPNIELVYITTAATMNLKSYIYIVCLQFIHDMWILGRTIAYRFVELNEGRHICYVIVSASAYLVFTDVNLGTTIVHTDISVFSDTVISVNWRGCDIMHQL